MSSKKKSRDYDAFREAMAGVKPLRASDRIEPVPRRTPARPEQREKDERSVMKELMVFDDPESLETGEELLWLRPGHAPRLLRRLRRGHFSIADTVDLHHMDVDTARTVLLDFISAAIERQQSCVRIVHGKGLRSRGLPRLKLMTRHVLSRHPGVVAFASCRPVDGGTGATLVLLSGRRVRPA
jgi:DNA-nicking Smr family endonuclease